MPKKHTSTANPKDVLDKIYEGNSADVLRELPSEFVDTIVTSPPYYGQRDYKVDGQIGSETTPEQYIKSLMDTFSEALRVLKPSGSLWLNLGDKYRDGVLLGMPWRVALALGECGYYLRSDIIWHKPNAMPSSVKSRPTTDHEYIFLLSKSRDYYYDADSIREPHVTFSENSKMRGGRKHLSGDFSTPENGKFKGMQNLHSGNWKGMFHEKGRNKRTVWSVPLSKSKDAHFAVFPEKLIEPCILAGAPEGGVVLDPFSGSGTTSVVAKKNGRHFVGIDINKDYCRIADDRLAQVIPSLF